MIGLIGCSLLALTTVRATWTHPSRGTRPITGAGQLAMDTVGKAVDHSVITRDTIPATRPDTSFRYRGDSATKITDTVISLADDAPAGPAAKKDAPATMAATKDTTVTPPKTDQPKTDQPKADPVKTETISLDNTNPPATTKSDSSAAQTAQATQTPPAQPAKASGDTTAEDKAEEQTRELDRRWFIAPGTKFQFQDFALLEKNRKGYLSDANTLPFFQRGNASFAASAYKNITNRLSISADIGLSFGHVTNDDVLISQTKSKTYNLLNAALYYHLIGPSYRLQPYLTVGFNDLINDKSYTTVPMGIGAKFNARKIMVLGQVTYGQSISKSVSSTTMYSLGIYIPIKSKKQKQLDQDDDSKKNKNDEAKKKDTVNKGGTGNVTNNIYITINMDSVLKAKGLLDDSGNPITAGGRRGNGDDDGDDAASRSRRKKKAFRSMGLDDFNDDDYKIDSLDGKPVIRFVVYFEFNEYGLNSKAFGSIDKVIRHLRNSNDDFSVEIKGYTDSVGTDQYNNMLSRKRAKMILDYMNSRGVPANLMQAKAYGSDNPVADNSDPNQAWLNRRAEIIVHKKEGLAAQ